MPVGKDIASALSNSGNLKFVAAEKQYNSLDCKSCHTMDSKSVGPSLRDISKRYSGKTKSDEILAKKIIAGGSGNWGTYVMPPHADLPPAEATAIAAYILSLDNNTGNLPMQGNFKLDQHLGQGKTGAYVLAAAYTDAGAKGIEPFKSSSYILLRDQLVQAEDFDEGNVSVGIGTLNTGFITYVPGGNGRFISFKQIDLTHIKALKFRIQEDGEGGILEIREGNRSGPVLGTAQIPAGKAPGPKTGWKEIVAKIKTTSGQRDIFLTFVNADQAKKALFNMDWIYFEN